MDAPQPQPQSQSQTPKREFAWQPLTFRGAGKFAAVRPGRLWLVQFLFSLAIAASVIWFVEVDCFPVVAKAAKRLPAASEIRGGKLDWQGDPAVVLAENRFLAIAIDVKHAGAARSPASLSIELGANDFKIFSLFGYIQVRYPRGWIISLAREEAIPWWGAWSPVILALSGVIAIGLMFLSWTILSTIYFLPAWLLAFFGNRELGVGPSWRLTGAAQLPGTLWLVVSIFAFGLAWFGLIGLALAFAAHIVVGWVYIVGSILYLPRTAEVAVAGSNPFAAKPLDPAHPANAESANPFDPRSSLSASSESIQPGPVRQETEKRPDDPFNP